MLIKQEAHLVINYHFIISIIICVQFVPNQVWGFFLILYLFYKDYIQQNAINSSPLEVSMTKIQRWKCLLIKKEEPPHHYPTHSVWIPSFSSCLECDTFQFKIYDFDRKSTDQKKTEEIVIFGLKIKIIESTQKTDWCSIIRVSSGTVRSGTVRPPFLFFVKSYDYVKQLIMMVQFPRNQP